MGHVVPGSAPEKAAKHCHYCLCICHGPDPPYPTGQGGANGVFVVIFARFRTEPARREDEDYSRLGGRGVQVCRNLRIRADPTPPHRLYTLCPCRSGAWVLTRTRVALVLILRLRHAHEPGQQTDGRLSGLSDKSALICAGRARQTPHHPAPYPGPPPVSGIPAPRACPQPCLTARPIPPALEAGIHSENIDLNH